MSEIDYYFDSDSFIQAESLVNTIVSNLSLKKREEPKNYGEIRDTISYSDKYADWSILTDNFLINTKTNDNPLYVLWNNIKSRCYNVNSISYDYYGGSGIKMDRCWKENFTAFASDILMNIGRKPKPHYTIDRINSSGDYVIDNVRWVTPLKQSRNKYRKIKISEKSSLALALLYKYYKVTGSELKNIYNNYISEDDAHKIIGSWSSIYTACRSYCQFI